MKSTSGRFFLAIAVALASAIAADASGYSVFDAGALPYGDYLSVSGINRSGVVVGTISSTNSDSGFTWSAAGGFFVLAPLSGYSGSHALGINDCGQVVGSSYSPGLADRACLWESGKPITDLGALTTSGTQSSTAFAINNAGQVVGTSLTSSGSSHAFLWFRGADMVDLNQGDPTYSTATAISNAGMVVGQYGGESFMWTSTAGVIPITVAPTDLPGIYADDVNNAGQVLFYRASASGIGQPFIWQNGQIAASIGLLSGTGYRSSVGYDINNVGQVVGRANDTHAFVWDQPNGIQELPWQSGMTRQAAYAINDVGVAAGYGRDSLGYWHLLVWTPVPEPSSLLALLAGLGGCGMILRRKQR